MSEQTNRRSRISEILAGLLASGHYGSAIDDQQEPAVYGLDWRDRALRDAVDIEQRLRALIPEENVRMGMGGLPKAGAVAGSIDAPRSKTEFLDDEGKVIGVRFVKRDGTVVEHGVIPRE